MIYFSIRKSKLRNNKVEDYNDVRRNLITFQITCFGLLMFCFIILFQRPSLAEPFTLILKEAKEAFVSVTPCHKEIYNRSQNLLNLILPRQTHLVLPRLFSCGKRPGVSAKDAALEQKLQSKKKN